MFPCSWKNCQGNKLWSTLSYLPVLCSHIGNIANLHNTSIQHKVYNVKHNNLNIRPIPIKLILEIYLATIRISTNLDIMAYPAYKHMNRRECRPENSIFFLSFIAKIVISMQK
uniref:Uncharacterized protein n=1 Tax=Micrurus spixii TaxID=129469 RepID=A0A2D4LBX0_9SAUR